MSFGINQDVDEMILSLLQLDDLIKLCQEYKYFNKLCHSDTI